jgi:aryl-alcohol dehydrogenase-like predicted oxidoreductase
MQKRTLGRTGLEVTQLGFGAMEIRGGGAWRGREVSEGQCETLLNAVLDMGINLVDTAPDYGLSEERIGRYISGRRDEYYLATKCGCDPEDKGGSGGHVWTRDQLLKNIEGSLKRLQTDHVDILQLHNPRDEDTPWDELVNTLREIQAQGMTRFIGVSHTLPWLSDCIAREDFDTFQIPYSCLETEHYDALTEAAGSGGGIIVRGGIAKGGPESDVARAERVEVWEKAKLSEVAGEMSPAELILRHTLAHPHCHTTIVGTLNPDHLRENVAAAEKGPVSSDVYEAVRSRVAAVL